MKLNVSVLLILALAFPCAQAQLNRGTITGIVTDPSGAAVDETKMKVVQLETNIRSSTTATESGNYTLPALPIGQYRLDIEAAGFKRAVRDNVSLGAGTTLRLDIALEIGSVTETVEVAATTVPIESESATPNRSSKLGLRQSQTVILNDGDSVEIARAADPVSDRAFVLSVKVKIQR